MSDTDLRAALKVFADMGSYDHPYGVTALAWFEAIMAARKVLNDQPANVVLGAAIEPLRQKLRQ